jgi:hypothetical protein
MARVIVDLKKIYSYQSDTFITGLSAVKVYEEISDEERKLGTEYSVYRWTHKQDESQRKRRLA